MKKNITISIKCPDGQSIKVTTPDDGKWITWKRLTRLFFDALKGMSYVIDDEIIEAVCD